MSTVICRNRYNCGENWRILSPKKIEEPRIIRILLLFCVFDGFGLADDVDLDLTGIGKLLLDLLCDIARQEHHLILGNILGLDHNADLASGLDGVAARNAGEQEKETKKHGKTSLSPGGLLKAHSLSVKEKADSCGRSCPGSGGIQTDSLRVSQAASGGRICGY